MGLLFIRAPTVHKQTWCGRPINNTRQNVEEVVVIILPIPNCHITVVVRTFPIFHDFGLRSTMKTLVMNESCKMDHLWTNWSIRRKRNVVFLMFLLLIIYMYVVISQSWCFFPSLTSLSWTAKADDSKSNKLSTKWTYQAIIFCT